MGPGSDRFPDPFASLSSLGYGQSEKYSDKYIDIFYNLFTRFPGWSGQQAS